MKKEQEEPGYQPRTVLLDEIVPSKVYELVITKLRGGAFVRYRIGDVMKCIALENKEDGIYLPQVKYLDRVSNIIDLAGFTRITKQVLGDAIKLSSLPITHWTAAKKYGQNQPYINLIFENPEGVSHEKIRKTLNETLMKVDSDYRDVHAMLGYDPLILTELKEGTFELFQKKNGYYISRINPGKEELSMLVG
jgi:hypothetical protein